MTFPSQLTRTAGKVGGRMLADTGVTRDQEQLTQPPGNPHHKTGGMKGLPHKKAQETCSWQTSRDETNTKISCDSASHRPKDIIWSGWRKSQGMKDCNKALLAKTLLGDRLAKRTIPQTKQDLATDKQDQAIPTDPRIVCILPSLNPH